MNHNGSGPKTSVSVIMPVRNEASFIRLSVGSVLAQDYPGDELEVIIADGMSTDETRTIVASMQAEHPNIRLIDNPGRKVSTGLNAAITHATGEVIIRVDGHCTIAPDYVRRCVEHIERDGVDCVGGKIHTIGRTTLGEVIAEATSSRFGVGNSAFRTSNDSTKLSDTVPFPAYTRAIIEKAGPYDEELVRNQDDEYNYRLRKLGARILLASDIFSTYYCRSSLRSLWRQYFEYGYWKVRVMQKHPRQMRWRQFVPPVFVGTVILFILLLPVWLPVELPLLVVAGTYLAANIIASFVIAMRSKWKLFPFLPAAFCAIHSAFGYGFLVGMVKFRNRWGTPADGNLPIEHTR